jgi:lambda repressor-like predicted transcriptional regulator
MGSALDELMEKFDESCASGARPSVEEVVAAVIHLEPRQAEAMCQVLWALPLECVTFYAQRNNAEAIAKREGYSERAAARQMGISKNSLRDLVDRSKKNLLAWFLTPAC